MAPMGVDLPDQSPGVLGLGFLVPYLPALETITERACGVRVVEFFWGEPDARTVSAGHAAGALVSWQVGSAVEAAAAQRAGCDIVVIQGVEAGGHVRGAKPLDVLLRDTVEAVTIPTVAAGGVGTPERVRALLDAGADAVRVGTRFLAASEANVHPDYLAALIASSAADTVLTGHFETMGGGRGLCASSEHRSKGLRPPAIAAPCPPRCGLDTPGTMPWYAGLSVDHVHKIQAAADIVADLTSLLR